MDLRQQRALVGRFAGPVARDASTAGVWREVSTPRCPRWADEIAGVGGKPQWPLEASACGRLVSTRRRGVSGKARERVVARTPKEDGCARSKDAVRPGCRRA